MKKLLVLAISASFAMVAAGCTHTGVGKMPIGNDPIVTKY